MKNVQVEFNTNFFIQLHEVVWYGINEPCEAVGHAVISTNVNPEPSEHSFFYDAEGNHYICLPSNEFNDDGEEDLVDMLVEDFIALYKEGAAA